MRKRVDDTGEERLATYDAVKAVVGLGDPIRPESRQQKVRGILQHVFGSSPKFGVVQRKLLGSSVDLVGRSVIVADPTMDMDHIGIPLEKAWSVYQPYIIRRLVRSGMPGMHAAKQVVDRQPRALEALQAEIKERPVLVNRAPTLHRYGMMAFHPVLTKGSPIRVSPIVTGGFGADFDGDTMQFHVPADPRAVKEAYTKLMPSKNLLSTSHFQAHYLPTMEYQGGLYTATARKAESKSKVFNSKHAAIEAYRRGEIGPTQSVEIRT
jgi:DNA-directed RNA polymerase subunit beta'